MTASRRFPAACIATPHYLASSAGLAVLASGGNAIDAAIAANLVLGVVTPYLCGYGGDLFAIVWDGEELHAYAGAGRAPAAATLDAVRARAGGDAMPRYGPLAVTVPGAVDGWFALLERFGTRPFDELVAPAMRYAREGFPLTARGAGSIAAAKQRYPDEKEWLRIYGAAAPGEPFVQDELAETIESLAAGGRDAFYRGWIADGIAEEVRARGGLLVKEDLAAHRGEWVTPLRARYRDVDVYEMPPPTQGVTALEALRIADGLPRTAPGSVERHHLLIEAMKQALADRELVTDPPSMPVPPERLLSDEWVLERRVRIDSARATHPEQARAARGGTAYLCAADRRGMLVSLIQSNFAGFGSGVTVPRWGINLQNRGSSFSLDPSHANVVAPGKRTMHTLIPAIAFRGDRPWLVFGTMGGDGQPQTHLQLLGRIVDDGEDPQEAIDAPRWIVAPAGWTVVAESRLGNEVIDGLRARGHDCRPTIPFDGQMGHAHAILVSDDGLTGATDPRAEGAVLGL